MDIESDLTTLPTFSGPDDSSQLASLRSLRCTISLPPDGKFGSDNVFFLKECRLEFYGAFAKVLASCKRREKAMQMSTSKTRGVAHF